MSEISAFGIIHKSFRKIRLPIANARQYDSKTVEHDTLNAKMRGHALEFRNSAGSVGASVVRRMKPEKREAWLNAPGSNKYGTRKPQTRREALRELKQGSQGLYDAIGREGRKNKRLP